MADIVGEINTIGDLLANVGVSRFYKQDLPTKYVANTIGIRWQGENDDDTFSQSAYGIDRIYQVVYFGSNEIDCITKIQKVRSALKADKKVKLRGIDDYMTLVSFNFAPPFKTDTDGVYAVSGVLMVKVYEVRPQEAYPKMSEVSTALYTEKGVATWSDVEVNPVEYSALDTAEWSDVRATLAKVAKEENENGGGN